MKFYPRSNIFPGKFPPAGGRAPVRCRTGGEAAGPCGAGPLPGPPRTETPPSAREITLKEADAGKEALKLTWTPASDYGLEEDVYYTLEIARADADYSEGLRRDMGKSALSISWTTEGLNDLLTDVLGASSGTMTKYKAMVTATIYGRDDLTQTAETEFSAAAFTPSPYTLFIDGDALGSPAAVMMTRENPGRFSWQGALKEGSVVFRTSDESDWPAYGAGTEEGVLAYYSEDPGTDVSIKIGQIGEYDITADLVDLTYTVRYSEAPVPDLIYIAGEAIGTGSYEDAVMMTRQEKGIFTYNDWVEPGKGFRFITGKLSWWPGYVRDRDRDSEDGMGVRVGPVHNVPVERERGPCLDCRLKDKPDYILDSHCPA